jgi:hypothetical protein
MDTDVGVINMTGLLYFSIKWVNILISKPEFCCGKIKHGKKIKIISNRWW